MSISSRVLRKFAGEDDLNQNNSEDGSDNDEIPFSNGMKKKQPNANRYDLLNEESNSEAEVNQEDGGNDEESEIQDPGQSQNGESSKEKKKKKRKRNRSNRRKKNDGVDEVERSIQEVNAILGDVAPVTQAQENSASCSKKRGILTVEHKHLNPKTELRRIFGPKIIQPEQGKKDHNKRNLKSTWLVTPKDHWPPISKLGLSMKLLETKNGIQYFTYEHSLNYQTVQRNFLEAVDSMDPDNIMMIANQSPYHVDAVLQVSEIFKFSDDLSMAAELIERALFSLESGFHPLFLVTKGNCRLDYRKQENRALFITLFKHLLFVGQRACYRTALEFCKLILSLDPDNDPLAIVLAMDFYSLRSREFEWFLQFVEQMDEARNLTQLPNIVFSKAVALFQLSDPSSNAVLQDALLMFPGVLFPLLENCGVQPDPKIEVHPYFKNVSSSHLPALNLLIQLFVHRNYYIWKEPDTLAWLEKNALEVLKIVDAKDPRVFDYAQKRSRRFEAKTPREIKRHVFLSEIKKVTSLLVDVSDMDVTLSFDPIPPLDSIDTYTRAERAERIERATRAARVARALGIVRPGRYERHDLHERHQRLERLERHERHRRLERQERHDRPETIWRIVRPGRHERHERHEIFARTARAFLSSDPLVAYLSPFNHHHVGSLDQYHGFTAIAIAYDDGELERRHQRPHERVRNLVQSMRGLLITSQPGGNEETLRIGLASSSEDDDDDEGQRPG